MVLIASSQALISIVTQFMRTAAVKHGTATSLGRRAHAHGGAQIPGATPKAGSSAKKKP